MITSIKKINNTSAIQFFQIARYAALLFSSILLTKSSLTQNDIGHYETFILMSGTLSFFWVNGLMNAFLSIYNKTENKNAAITQTAIALLLFSSIIIIILLIFRNSILSLFQFYDNGNIFTLFLLYFLFNNVSFIVDYILLAKGNTKYLVILGIYHIVFQTALISAPAFIYESYDMVVKGLIIFIAIKFILTIILILRNISFQIDKVLFRLYIVTATPLIIAFFLGGISIYVDGIIVNNFYDKATFAVYQYGAREFPLSLLLANAFSAAMALHISNNPQNLDEVRTGSLRLINRLFPVCIILLVVSQWLYPIIFNANFKESYIYFNIYLLLLIPRLVFPHSILIGLGKTRDILFASMVEFLLNIVLSLSLMQLIGLQGIAYGTVIAFIVNKAILARRLKKAGINAEVYIPVKQLIFYSIILIIVFITFTYLIN